MITLNETQVKELEAFIQEMPTKYGLPLLNFLNKIAQDQKTDVEQVVAEVTE
jgi:hypothetical protein